MKRQSEAIFRSLFLTLLLPNVQLISREPSPLLLGTNTVPIYYLEDLPEILLFIFMKTYVYKSNTVIIVPGCTQPTTQLIENDILDKVLPETDDQFVLEIQRDFTKYNPASVTFLWFIDSRASFR